MPDEAHNDDCCPHCKNIAWKVDEIHEMLTKFTEALEKLGKNPMLRAMVPPGVLPK